MALGSSSINCRFFVVWKTTTQSYFCRKHSELRHALCYCFTLFVCSVLTRTFPAVLGEDSSLFTDCGGTLRDLKGVIWTPNFPNPYPTPISCRWKIEAPGNQMIALYLTQFYMREGLRATEYAYFEDESQYMGKTDLGFISADSKFTQLVTNKTILVLDFTVLEQGNIHLRVIDMFLDVYGFNITYETVSKTEYRTDPCIQNHCSFNGKCIASADFSVYQCHCLQNYYGEECQFSPECGPEPKSNLCFNGGTCRHNIGSRIRECICPPGYEGSKCEKRPTKDSSDRNEYFSEESKNCLILGCSHTCKKLSLAGYICTCPTGYQLGNDLKTCAKSGRTRYLLSFKLINRNFELHRRKQNLESAIASVFRPSLLRKVENLTVLSFKPGAVVQFHFFGDREDSAKIRRMIEGALRKGQIGRYRVDRNYIQFEQEPPLNILRLEASQGMPIIEGVEMFLKCIFFSSSVNSVKWRKDGFPINIDLDKRIWTKVLPKNSKDQYTAVLGISKVHILDSGIFTCEVTDWGMVQDKKLNIAVVSAPQSLLVPLVQTLREGEKAVITCLTKDASLRNVGFNWLKDGRILNPSKQPELIEDIFPTGSRVVIHSVKKSATYSCILTTAAGMTRRDSNLMVLDKTRDIPKCLPEEYQSFGWNLTVANSYNIKYCGKGYIGEVRRHCSLKEKGVAIWEEPDFSSCLSEEFLQIREQFEKLTLGYLENNISSIAISLKKYLETKIKTMHYREGASVLDLLNKVHSFHQQISSQKEVTDTTEVLLDIASLLLTNSYVIHKQSYMLQIHQLLLNHGLSRGAQSAPGIFHMYDREAFVLQTVRMMEEGQHILKFPSFPEILKGSKQDNMQKNSQTVSGKHPWLTDELEVSYNTYLMSDAEHLNESIVTTVVFYKNLSVFLPPRFLIRRGDHDIESELCSSIMAVGIKSGQHLIGLEPNDVKVQSVLKKKVAAVNVGAHNLFCGLAFFTDGKLKFHLEGCQPTEEENYTVCVCDRVGMFAVLKSSFIPVPHIHEGFDVIVGVGCALCICLVLITMLILLVCWRKIRGPLTALKIQSCIAVLGAYSSLTGALHESLHKEYYPHVVSLVMFFLLASICMQLCLGLTICVEFVELKTIQHLEQKIAAMGWAVPIIVVGATLAAQVLEGFDLDSWWLLIGTSFFYAFVTSGSIIVVLYLLLYLTVKAELRRQEKINPQLQRRILNRAGMLRRSLFIFLLLLLVSTSSILFTNFEENIFNYFFSLSSALLGIFIFVFYTVKSENDSDEQFRRNSFKMYVKPEMMKDSPYYLDALEELPAEKVSETKLQVETYSYKKHYKERNHLMANHTKGKTNRSPQKVQIDSESGETDTENEENTSGTPPRFRRLRPLFQKSPNPMPFELQNLEGSPKSSHHHLKDFSPLGGSDGESDNQDKSNCCTTTSYSSQSSPSCQLHSIQPNIAHSDFSESGSSNSSSLEEQSALYIPANVRLGNYIPYKPSSLLQREESVISEEDENEESQASTIKPASINVNSHSPLETQVKENESKAADDCDDNTSPAKIKIGSPEASEHDSAQVLLVSGSQFSSAENDKVGKQVPNSCKRKSWSITAV
ncbi:uncharacterized protein LOC143237832 isoform X2 [Tachypleus tridentatus]|uniref:uncharacterized protein LOC143237832 isoform X2 n=1 Tax=Tachypleus tridentatus TaxID=6853 RepID=UPI003FD00DFA